MNEISPKYGSRGVVWHGGLVVAPWTEGRHQASKYVIEGVDEDVLHVLQTAKRGRWAVILDGETVGSFATKQNAQHAAIGLIRDEVDAAEARYYRVSIDHIREVRQPGYFARFAAEAAAR